MYGLKRKKKSHNDKTDGALETGELMKMESGDPGPCSLLFVSERNLPDVVARTAPHMILVNRDEFTRIATAMLAIVESVAKQTVE